MRMADILITMRFVPGRDRLVRLGATAAVAAAGAGAGVLAQRRHARRIAVDPERAILEAPLAGRPLTACSSDGTELHVEVFGADEAPTLVLAHGWTEALGIWVYVIRELSDQFRIVAYDLRGHGHSGRAPGDDYSMARLGDDLEAVLATTLRDGERAIVAGHSLGGMSIAAWAEHHDVPGRASGAGLLFTGVGGLVGGQLVVHVPRFARAFADPFARHALLGSRASLPRVSTPVSHAAIRYVAFGRTATPAQIAFFERMLVSCPPDVRAKTGLAMQDIELYHVLPRLTIPTLVMAGEKDRLTPPSHARRIAAELPNPYELIVLPETGHMGPLEHPMDVSDALRRLAADVRNAAVAPGSRERAAAVGRGR
jgi:pimeloyl-ACP methyl ester carboxylesterase